MAAVRKNKDNAVIFSHLVIATIWEKMHIKEISIEKIAGGTGLAPQTVHNILSGRSFGLTVNRLMDVAQVIKTTPKEIMGRAAEIEGTLVRSFGPTEIITEFPDAPPPGRLFRAWEIEYWLGHGDWTGIYGGSNLQSDDVWRARLERGMSRSEAAKKLGVTDQTVKNWELAYKPDRHDALIRKVYGLSETGKVIQLVTPKGKSSSKAKATAAVG